MVDQSDSCQEGLQYVVCVFLHHRPYFNYCLSALDIEPEDNLVKTLSIRWFYFSNLVVYGYNSDLLATFGLEFVYKYTSITN